MRSIVFTIVITACLAGTAAAQEQDRPARKLAGKLAAAFTNGLGPLDREHLVRGRLTLSQQYWITDVGEPEFRSKAFNSFAAMERWMKRAEQPDGTPFRSSGDRISCRSGICRLDLVDNQMAHNHVFLTRIWYGRTKGKLYVRKLRILYG